LLFFIGLFASFFGTLAGGGGLITIPAMMLFGLPVHIGVATNKFSSGIASLSGVLTLIKQKALTWKQTSRYLFVAILGGIMSAIITSHVNERTMNWVAMLLLTFALMISLKNGTGNVENKVFPLRRRTYGGPFSLLFMMADLDRDHLLSESFTI
jgi:uncharacterized protein